MPPDSKSFRFYYIPHCSECAKHINANTGEPLSLETTLYPIINFCDSQLNLLISYANNINLYVILPSSKRIKIEIALHDTVHVLKKCIEQLAGLPPNQQRLIFMGKLLEEEKCIFEYGITADCDIRLVVRYLGA